MWVYSLASSHLKKVQAQVRKERFAEVDAALRRIGVPGLTFTEEQRAGRGLWTYPLESVKHVLLTVVVDDSSVDKVVESICEGASTKSWGDGTISVSTIDQVFDIASGKVDRSELAAPPISL